MCGRTVPFDSGSMVPRRFVEHGWVPVPSVGDRKVSMVVGGVDHDDVGAIGQEVAADDNHGAVVEFEDGEPAALGGGPEPAVGWVVAEHVREMADALVARDGPGAQVEGE